MKRPTFSKEWLMIAAMTLGGFLFAWGGTGWKPARRFLLPLVLGAIVFLAKKPLWRCAVLAAGLMVAFSLPYGETTPYWVKMAVFCSYSLATVVLGFTWWQVVVPVMAMALFILSNTPAAAATVPWKVVEFLYGAGVGVIVAVLLSREDK